MRSEGEKRFKYRSLLICFLCDRLFWIPVTVAVVFDDYTIQTVRDARLIVLGDRSSYTGFSSEILLKNFIRNSHSGFWLTSSRLVIFFCGESFVRNFRRRLLMHLCGFCQDVIFLRAISTQSLRVLIARAIIEP